MTLVLVLPLFFVGKSWAIVQSDSTDNSIAAQVRIGFLYNFAKYVEWENDESLKELRYCVLAENELTQGLKILESQEVRGKNIRLVPVTSENIKMTDCQLVYLGKEVPNDAVTDIFLSLQGKNTLIVTEKVTVGTIRFFEFENKLRFRVDAVRAKGDRLKLSSQLLSLSRIPPQRVEK